MNLTVKLKAWAVANLGLSATASDAEFRKGIAGAILKKKLLPAKLKELTTETDDEQKARKAAAALNVGGKKKSAKKAEKAAKIDIDALVNEKVAEAVKAFGGGSVPEGRVSPQSMLAKGAKSYVRVKSAFEQYSDTKTAAVYPQNVGFKGAGGRHPMAGLPAQLGTQQLFHPSDRDKAVSSAFFKWSLSQTSAAHEIPQRYKMTDHDRDLINYAVNELPWTGFIGKSRGAEIGVNRQKLDEFARKTLLDDSISGGIEATPVVFDDAIILLPVLYGELFPFVDLKTVAEGRRMKGAAMAQPAFTSGVAEGTQIQPYNTSAFISAFDTPIYPAVASMEIGLDFEEDSPVDVGGNVIEIFGLQSLKWLDRVVAVGDGVTEPQGFFNASGTTVVNSDNGAGGPLTVSDFEGLMFGVAKEFRTEAGSMPVYVSNDQGYRSGRSIAVGPGDERRVFGMDHQGYRLLEAPYKVQNDIPNGWFGYINLRRYRMYRRLGLTVRIETAGRALALANTKLIVLRMRYGGQLTTGGAAAIMKDGKA